MPMDSASPIADDSSNPRGTTAAGLLLSCRAMPSAPAPPPPALIAAGPAADRPAAGTALALFDAFLAEAARAEPAYRADPKPGVLPVPAPPGRLQAESPLAGPFTYRPKTFAELDRRERAELLRDPRFHAFLIEARRKADGGIPALPAERRDHRVRAVVSPSPEEMLRPGAVRVTLPPP